MQEITYHGNTYYIGQTDKYASKFAIEIYSKKEYKFFFITIEKSKKIWTSSKYYSFYEYGNPFSMERIGKEELDSYYEKNNITDFEDELFILDKEDKKSDKKNKKTRKKSSKDKRLDNILDNENFLKNEII